MKLFENTVKAVILSLSVFAFTGNSILSQSQYPVNLLEQKGNFSAGAARALGEPFRGVATADGIASGLFPLKSTGVSTAPIQEAADKFLATLSTADLSRTHFAISDPEWRDWSNVDVGIFPRRGISLEDMNDLQKSAAWDLLGVALSAEGLEQTQNIMKTEQTLFEINGEPIRYGTEKYYFTVMGIPSLDKPWGFQLDGHHLVINYFVLGDQVVMTPAFWGGEPVYADSGMYEGNHILQEEQNAGLELMQSLNSGQKTKATLGPNKVRNNQIAAANQDNLILDYEGIRGSELNSQQKLGLLNVIRSFIGALRSSHAEITMDEIGQYIDDTYFAWIGGSEDDAIFYYRVHSPVILIEFDHQGPVGTLHKNPAGVPTRDHIHTIVRTPNGNDYGKDILAQHLAEDH
ncbi:MAG: DUF3500 domain-containing protein [Gammaproteobacteria bacterium]|nr:DUF3500 domain-containing protein [Gammaproteobacteria bacterium]